MQRQQEIDEFIISCGRERFNDYFDMTQSRACEIAQHYFSPLVDLADDAVHAIVVKMQRSINEMTVAKDKDLRPWKGCCIGFANYCLRGQEMLRGNSLEAAKALQRFSGWFHRCLGTEIHNQLYDPVTLPYLKIGEEWVCSVERLEQSFILEGWITLWNYSLGKPNQIRTDQKLDAETRSLASRILTFLCANDYPDVVIEKRDLDHIESLLASDPAVVSSWHVGSNHVDTLSKKVQVPATAVTKFLDNRAFDPNITTIPLTPHRKKWMNEWSVVDDDVAI